MRQFDVGEALSDHPTNAEGVPVGDNEGCAETVGSCDCVGDAEGT
jgi:hypothetical protein